MKIQQNRNLQLNNNPQKHSKASSAVSFGGVEILTNILRTLDTNKAWGATLVDIGCMGAPRTAVDLTRSPEAGIETMRREFSSTANNTLIGTYGMTSAGAFAYFFNKKFGVKAQEMLMNDDTFNILNRTWSEKGNVRGFAQAILENARGFNPEEGHLHGWVGIDDATREKIVKKLIEDKSKDKFAIAETKAYIKALILESTGAESKFKLQKTINTAEIKTVSSLDDFVDNLYKATKIFNADKVKVDFKDFVKRFKNINTKTGMVGMLIAGLVGASLQPVNVFLTRKLTGKTGFVGVEGREPEKSQGFKILKYCIGVLAAAGALSTIGKPKEILKKIQFKGFAPTIEQFKFVYGMTIASRLVSSRDKNELRETVIKDSLGFANWLILGGVVSKLTALVLENLTKEKFLLHNEVKNGTNLFNRLTKSSIITRDEILYSEFKKAGMSVIEEGKALPFKEMLKRVSPAVKRRINLLGIIQISGYLYSGIVLGTLIPKLNIAITNAVENKNPKAQKNKPEPNKEVSNTSSNKEFLASKQKTISEF